MSCFYASQSTSSGAIHVVFSFEKGKNNMNKLLEIVIRWYSHEIGFNTDIKKMYNSLQLKEEHWCFQHNIWHYIWTKRNYQMRMR